MNDNKPYTAHIDHAVERITPRFRGDESVLRQMLAPPIDRAYHQGRNDALRDLMPVSVVAEKLGVNTSRVHQIARPENIGWVIGRERLFTPEDVETLRNRPDGRAKRDS